MGLGHKGLSMEQSQSEEHILSKACIYKYTDNESDDDEEYCWPNNISNQTQTFNELSKIKPIHVNMIDLEVGDSALSQLLPYSSLIYGLSLSDNFFTNKSLDDLAKFHELRYLDITNNSFLFPSLDSLATLDHLRCLKVTYNRIDPTELKSLQNKLQAVEIIL